MENLTLKFHYRKNVTEKALYFLLYMLAEVLTLRYLYLEFIKPQDILFPEKAICDLLKGLTVLKNLVALQIWCPCEPGNSIQHAVKSYRNLKGLETLLVNEATYI
mgnify:CR=1 FL=1